MVFNLQSRHKYMVEMAMFNGPRAITTKVSKPELWFMCSAHCLKVLYICVTISENILNGFQLTERTQVYGRNDYVQCSKAITPKVGRPELRFMCSAHRLMVLHICVQFGENISDGIRVIEWTWMMEALTNQQTDRVTLKILDGITLHPRHFLWWGKKICLTYANSIVNWIFGKILSENIFCFSSLIIIIDVP